MTDKSQISTLLLSRTIYLVNGALKFYLLLFYLFWFTHLSHNIIIYGREASPSQFWCITYNHMALLFCAHLSPSLPVSLSGSPFLFSFILLHFSLTIQCSLGSSFVIQTIAMQLLNHIIEVEEVSARMLERGREKKIREKLRAPVGSGGGISSSHYNHLWYCSTFYYQLP